MLGARQAEVRQVALKPNPGVRILGAPERADRADVLAAGATPKADVRLRPGDLVGARTPEPGGEPGHGRNGPVVEPLDLGDPGASIADIHKALDLTLFVHSEFGWFPPSSRQSQGDRPFALP